jgi:photosystem II stability/assembly factor-like uncharacterized protein
MRRKSFALVLVLMFSLGFLMPGFLLSSQVKADTAGWQLQDAGVPGGFALQCVSAVDSETVWVGGEWGELRWSVDGGSTWSPSANPPGTNLHSYGMSAVDASTAWAGGIFGTWGNTDGFVSGTTDGGATWSIQGGLWRGIVYGISAVDAQTAWAVGGAYMWTPVIIKTTDGVAWSGAYGETTGNAPLCGVSAVDANTVWAVGTNGMILKTTDGTNWTHQDFTTTSDLKGVSAVDASTAWAVGEDGLIIHTTDGTTWSAQDSGVTTGLNGISAVNASTAWAVGTGGTILKTNDSGATWIPQASGITSDLNGVSAVDSNTAWAVGAGGVILHTTNGGVEPPTITSITPTYGVENTIVDVTNLTGTGFQADAIVRIEKTGTTIDATDVTVVSSTKITCKLNLTGAPLGKYDVVVRNTDAQEAKLTQGFSVTNICGGGAAISLSVFGIMMGLLSLAGSTGLRRRLRRKKK